MDVHDVFALSHHGLPRHDGLFAVGADALGDAVFGFVLLVVLHLEGLALGEGNDNLHDKEEDCEGDKRRQQSHEALEDVVGVRQALVAFLRHPRVFRTAYGEYLLTYARAVPSGLILHRTGVSATCGSVDELVVILLAFYDLTHLLKYIIPTL